MKFRGSPFYAYYSGLAQFQADEATKKVFAPLDKEDPYAVQHREQLIGETTAYIFIPARCAEDLLSLQDIVTKQTNGQS